MTFVAGADVAAVIARDDVDDDANDNVELFERDDDADNAGFALCMAMLTVVVPYRASFSIWGW